MKQTESHGTLKFPSWKYVLYALMDEHRRTHILPASTHELIDQVLLRFNHVREIIQDYHPAKIHQLLGMAQARYIPKEPLGSMLERLKLIPVAGNEFYSAFDMRTNDFTIVDPRISEVLGVAPEDFNIRSLLGFDPRTRLAHPRDVNHWIRWGSLAYLMLSLPVFSFESMRVCFQIRFRISTSASSIAALRKQGSVMLDQRAYPHFETDENGIVRPTYHLDHWSVYPAPADFCVAPFCTTDFSVQAFTNALLYLFNAFLLDMPVKYLLLLNERMGTDRNKEVAIRLNDRIKTAAGLRAGLDETKVGNYFAKSIRTSVYQIGQRWNPHEGLKPPASDHEAVMMARSLGLLPMPDDVLRLAVAGVTDE